MVDLLQDILRFSVRHKIRIAAFSFPKEPDSGVFRRIDGHHRSRFKWIFHFVLLRLAVTKARGMPLLVAVSSGDSLGASR